MNIVVNLWTMNNYIVGTPLIDLTPPHCCACPKPGHGFLTPYVVVFLVFNDLRSEVVVRFVDIGRIVDRHFLNFLSTVRLLN